MGNDKTNKRNQARRRAQEKGGGPVRKSVSRRKREPGTPLRKKK